MNGIHRWLGAAVLLHLVACGPDGCWWTGDPIGEPTPPAELNRAYTTEGGAFTVLLRGDDPWPPIPGMLPLRIEWSPPDPPPPMPRLTVARPRLMDDDLAAPADPEVVAVDELTWRIDGLELDAPGRWELELTLEQGELTDQLTLAVEVVDE